MTLFTAWRNRSKLIGFNKKSTALRSNPSMAYLRNAVVKITFGGLFRVLKKLVPRMCGILISRNKRSTWLFCRKDRVSTALEHSAANCSTSTPAIYFFKISLAGGSSSITRHFIFLDGGMTNLLRCIRRVFIYIDYFI